MLCLIEAYRIKPTLFYWKLSSFIKVVVEELGSTVFKSWIFLVLIIKTDSTKPGKAVPFPSVFKMTFIFHWEV